MNMVLNDVCEVYSGYALKSFNEGKEGFPVIKIGNILTDGRLSLEDCQYTTETVNTKYYSQKDDVYVALSGATTGKIGLMETDESYVINQRVGIVRRKDKKIPSRFIKYFLLKQTERILQEAAGCAQPNISPKQIGAYTFPSFSSEKMEEITRELDKVTNVIQYRYKQNNLLDCLIKARFVEMFGDLRANSKGWPIHTFREITEIITDGEHITPRRVDHGIYLLSARNVLDHSLQLDDVDYIDQEEYERISKRIVPMAGDVLISCSGSVGRCCMVPIGLKFQMVRSVAILRFKNILVPKYAEYMISSDELQDQISRAKTASSQANLFQGKIAELKGFVPPLELQKKFVDFVEQVDKSKVVVPSKIKNAIFAIMLSVSFGQITSI